MHDHTFFQPFFHIKSFLFAAEQAEYCVQTRQNNDHHTVCAAGACVELECYWEHLIKHFTLVYTIMPQ